MFKSIASRIAKIIIREIVYLFYPAAKRAKYAKAPVDPVTQAAKKEEARRKQKGRQTCLVLVLFDLARPFWLKNGDNVCARDNIP